MIPIFILTYDRLTVLKKSIRSYYDYIKTPFEIVIIDFGSTYKPTLEYLKGLERKEVKIYWGERMFRKVDVNKPVQEAVGNYFKDHPVSNYVITDPDIALDNVEGNILEVYSYLLETFPKIPVVGPMLRLDDLPDHFPSKQGIINWEAGLTWRGLRNVHSIRYKGKVVKFISHTRLDTTFRMNRAGTLWKRSKRAFRVLPPYGAKHLDWYLDPNNLTEDHKYYMKHAVKGISHSFGVGENQ